MTLEASKKKSEQLLVRVEPDIREWLVLTADKRRIKVAQVIRDALYKYKEDNEKESKNGKLREL